MCVAHLDEFWVRMVSPCFVYDMQAAIQHNRVYRFLFAARSGIVMHKPPPYELLHPRINVSLTLNALTGVTPPDHADLLRQIHAHGPPNTWLTNYIQPVLAEVVADNPDEDETVASDALAAYNADVAE